MSLLVGIPRETFPGERRVAMVPRVFDSLAKSGMKMIVERSAGLEAGFPDQEYLDKGAQLATREEVFAAADIVLQVRTLGANPVEGRADLPLFKRGQIVIGFSEPLMMAKECAELAERGVTLFAMELIPRITRAQSMDALSSMATAAGYKAVLMAAEASPRMFPMLTTAAGTIAPAKVFVLGVGVAGLQAIATARRLGAVVSAYDVRPAVKEQVLSVGAKFVELPIEAQGSEDKGGYAKAMGEEFYRKQRELLMSVLKEMDVVITTAAVPGKKAPILLTAEMVKAMPQGSIVVDVAAERGGNCELTRPGETVVVDGVTIMGPANLPAKAAYHTSQMYAKNLATLLAHLAPKGNLAIKPEDEITRESMVAHEGTVVQSKVAELLGLTAKVGG